MNECTVGNLLLVNIQDKKKKKKIYIPTFMLAKPECFYINGENNCRG